MKGKHRAVIQNSRLHYELEIKRNITVIQGDSATGKTTLINMIRQHENLGDASGVEISCDVACRVLEGQAWELILRNSSGSIFFLDEENAFINTEEFAAAVRQSDNYVVLITRENLYNLPYSVEEIYGLRSAGKYQNTRKVYQQTYRIYSPEKELPVKPEHIITEDTNAGYEFFGAVSSENGLPCVSAGGKTGIHRLLAENAQKASCVIADGAAIGPEMNRLYEVSVRRKNVSLYLPESFEWLILKSGLIDGNEVQEILDHPEEYIESQEFFSWERFFSRMLMNYTQGTYLQYTKRKLNAVYLHEKNRNEILKTIKGIVFSG